MRRERTVLAKRWRIVSSMKSIAALLEVPHQYEARISKRYEVWKRYRVVE